MTKTKAQASLTAILMLGALALGASACGGEDGDGQFGAAEAQKVTRVTWNAVSRAQSDISSGLDSANAADANGAQSDLVDSDGSGSWTINGTIKNPNGSGELQLAGSATRDGTGFSVNVTGTFKAWSAEGITLDGPLTLTFDLVSLIPADLSSTLKGTLDVAGILPVALPVSVDLTATVKGTQASICGNVAGQPVSVGGC